MPVVPPSGSSMPVHLPCTVGTDTRSTGIALRTGRRVGDTREMPPCKWRDALALTFPARDAVSPRALDVSAEGSARTPHKLYYCIQETQRSGGNPICCLLGGRAPLALLSMSVRLLRRLTATACGRPSGRALLSMSVGLLRRLTATACGRLSVTVGAGGLSLFAAKREKAFSSSFPPQASHPFPSALLPGKSQGARGVPAPEDKRSVCGLCPYLLESIA